jgi:mono/diheme cytochrome c family protein
VQGNTNGNQLNAIDRKLCDPLPKALKVFGRKQGSIERIASAAAVIAFSVLTFAAPCHSEPNAQAGKAFALANCSHCHSIDKFTSSSLAIAPPFRALHLRYPVESLEEALAEGIMTGHPSMPEFKLDPGQIGDFISFLKSLEQ